jgi:hypothetical protein
MSTINEVHVNGPALPEPSEAERKAIATARDRAATLKRRPAFRLGLTQELKKETSIVDVKSAHSDQKGWAARFFETFGTTSDDFVSAELSRLSHIRGGRQKVTVEHVHVYPGGQAIVGNVSTRGPGGDEKKGQQPHAIQDATSNEALWRQDPEREAMPRLAGNGQTPMPNARGRSRLGSPEGKAKRKLPARSAHSRGNSRASRAGGVSS